jgi:TRAP-type C4-dicarboxylate transport system permease large subunit
VWVGVGDGDGRCFFSSATGTARKRAVAFVVRAVSIARIIAPPSCSMVVYSTVLYSSSTYLHGTGIAAFSVGRVGLEQPAHA